MTTQQLDDYDDYIDEIRLCIPADLTRNLGSQDQIPTPPPQDSRNT